MLKYGKEGQKLKAGKIEVVMINGKEGLVCKVIMNGRQLKCVFEFVFDE